MKRSKQNTVTNTPIQGEVADIVMDVMLDTIKADKNLISQLQDTFIFEVKKGEEDKSLDQILISMEEILIKLKKENSMKKSKKERQESAITRQESYSKLSVGAKITRAKNRKGSSKKEIEKLEKLERKLEKQKKG